jgi:lycopene beta-cyclase
VTRVAIVGGGLAGSLAALWLRRRRPELALLLVEREGRPGGQHTWCAHATDLTPEERAELGELVVRSWDAHRVRFPAFERRLEGGYLALTSERLAAVVEGELGASLRVGAPVSRLEATGVVLEDGERIEADCVIDARGLQQAPAWPLGYQKFLGRTLRLAEDHDLGEPLLMDATVPQSGGFRFVYALPFAPRRLLVEDTCYASDASLDVQEYRAGIDAWVRARGLRVEAVESEERGMLPIPLGGSPAGGAAAVRGVGRIGMRGGLFHATTGYSLPEALRCAAALAALPVFDPDAVSSALERRAVAVWRRGRFLRLQNRMHFGAARPDQRFRVLEHFYRLPEPVIARFYADRLGALDRLRILSGRPPVPLLRAARCAFRAPAVG